MRRINVIEEGISFDENMAIVNTSALLDSPSEITPQDNGSSFVFDETRYIGAVDPSSSVAWWG